MGCGASGGKKYSVDPKAVAVGDRFIFKVKDEKCRQVYRYAGDDEPVEVKIVDPGRTGWFITVTFAKGGQESKCLIEDLSPVPPDYKWPDPPAGVAAPAAQASAPAATPAASAPAPKAAASAPAAKAAASAPAATSATKPPDKAAAAKAYEEKLAAKVAEQGAAESKLAKTASYTDSDGKTWMFCVQGTAPPRLSIYCDEALIGAMPNGDKLVITFDWPQKKVLFEFDKGSKRPYEKSHDMDDTCMTKLREVLKDDGFKFNDDVEALAAAQKRAEEEKLKKAQEALAQLPEEWKKATLVAHNKARETHQAPPLTWSDECYLKAKLQADACQLMGKIHKGNLDGASGKHGQNCFWGARGSPPGKIIFWWLFEKGSYDFEKGVGNSQSENFTQLAWKATTSVGLAASQNGMYFVANYLPAGNQEGQFKENVVDVETIDPDEYAKYLGGLSGPDQNAAEFDLLRKSGYSIPKDFKGM